MKRAAGALIAAFGLLVIGISASGGSGSARFAIAYVRGGQNSVPEVWLAGADGRGGHRLGGGQHPLISPDGSIVAASTAAAGGPALILYSASGSTLRAFFDVASATALAESWSGDSRYVAVVLSSTDPVSAAASGLAVVDTKTLTYVIVARGVIYGASFAADGSDRLVYAAARSLALTSRKDIHVVSAVGTGAVRLTHDGRSLNPVWGRAGIAFDREQIRRRAEPAYQVWLMSPAGSARRRLTHLRVPALLNGLVPLGFSDDGGRLLAEYEGQDTSQAWAITVDTRQARALKIGGHTVVGAAISHDGEAVLVDRGGFLNPPDNGAVVTMPFASGHPTTLVAHGAAASWNL